MAKTTTIWEWEITVSVTRVLKYPLCEARDKKEIKEWVNNLYGLKSLQQDFLKRFNCYGEPRNADMTIDDVQLKETEVKSTDTDPRI